jgi:hypothetical protein
MARRLPLPTSEALQKEGKRAGERRWDLHCKGR